MDNNVAVGETRDTRSTENPCDSNFIVNLTDNGNLEEKLRQLQAELDECRSLVTVAECQKENAIETEQRKCQEEVASIQRIMEETVTDAVRTTTSRFEKEISHLQKVNEKLKVELAELKSVQNRDNRTEFTREGVLAAVTKSLKRVSNISGPLPFVSTGESSENLEESMKKVRDELPYVNAQEDAEVLSSLIVPLEQEIKALKDKLRSTDEQLRMYETAFARLVKGLGCDSLSEMVKGKGPAEVVEHLDEKLMSLSQGLQAEKASRSDLEMYVAVLNTQKTVTQEDNNRLKKELQEVCHLLEKEKKEHSSLKRTWQMANDQFLEAQRLQTMDMIRIQSVLTSEQQRQISELKRRDEEKMGQERKVQPPENSESKSKIPNEVPKGRISPFSKLSPSKAVKSSPVLHRRQASNQSRLSDEVHLLSPPSTKAQSIPCNLNQAGDGSLPEQRSMSSSALSKMMNSPKNAIFLPISPQAVDEETSLKSVTPEKLPSLTQDQLKALSDLTPELEVRKSLIDNARAEMESISLVGKRLVSETEWQLLEEELRKAREKFGQPCEMCSNYELQLQLVQRLEQEQRQKAAAVEQMLEGYKKDLEREQEYRNQMETKFDTLAKECEIKVTDLFKRHEEVEKSFSQRKNEYESLKKRALEHQESLRNDREALKVELLRLQQDNNRLLGKHLAKAQQMRNQEIDLPNSIEELQFYCLQRQEELISAMASKEDTEENLRSEIQMLKNQLTSEQTAKESLEDTLMQEMDSLREQLGIAESQKSELQSHKDHSGEIGIKLSSLQQELSRKELKLAELLGQVDELSVARVKLEDEVRELKAKVQSLQGDLDNSEAVQKDFVKLSQSLQMELEKIRQSDCEVRWQHEEDVTECNSCKKNFQSKKEKVHCSHCGKIFCLECSSKSVCSGPNQRQFKVCNVCHTLLDHQTAPYFSSEPPLSPS